MKTLSKRDQARKPSNKIQDYRCPGDTNINGYCYFQYLPTMDRLVADKCNGEDSDIYSLYGRDSEGKIFPFDGLSHLRWVFGSKRTKQSPTKHIKHGDGTKEIRTRQFQGKKKKFSISDGKMVVSKRKPTHKGVTIEVSIKPLKIKLHKGVFV